MGSVIVLNRSGIPVEIRRDEDHPAYWWGRPDSVTVPVYVQTNGLFWLNSPTRSRSFVVSGPNERYLVYRDQHDGLVKMICIGAGMLVSAVERN